MLPLLAIAHLLAAAPHSAGVEMKRPEPVRRAALRFAGAVRRRDVAGLLDMASPAGITCGEEQYAPRDLPEYLGEPGSWLHASLFSTREMEQQAKRRPAPYSFAEFLKRAGKGVRIEVRQPDERNDGFACTYFHAAGLEYVPEVCFQKSGGRWRWSFGPGC
ncbi:hypothetical protein [Anaeromyxobacter paludicola]|uniref:Uncharacterized protein n=1 Tax=Anaeromyxobacter paludicola TaxID=2918171 RepID=A0ABM7XAQ2_9BACT|nr:hypothetical protein [Anaeromyxobacter paludicola]BDG08937.1 hypothetical protein AMPC_20500 [Anaeromyxobacter paludicola]